MNDQQAEPQTEMWAVKPIPLTYLPEGVRVVENIAYGSDDLQKVDAYLPESTAPTPVLIELHGGGWRTGSKQQLGMYKGLIEKTLESGIAVVAADYRLTPKYPWPAQAQDAVRVVQFVRSKAGEWHLDASRVALIGGSAGAHLSVWVAMHDDFAEPDSADAVERLSSRVSCAVDCWGPMDLDHFHLEGRGVAIGTQLFQCRAEEWDSPRVLQLRREASPSRYITPDDPPVMIVHNQPEVPLPDDPGWTTGDGHSSLFGVLLKSRLEAAGVRVEALFSATPETWCPGILAFLRECFG